MRKLTLKITQLKSKVTYYKKLSKRSQKGQESVQLEQCGPEVLFQDLRQSR